MGKIPAAIPTTELLASYELSGLKRAGMTRADFVAIMEDLDGALIDFYIRRSG